jgi:hypothetical protein
LQQHIQNHTVKVDFEKVIDRLNQGTEDDCQKVVNRSEKEIAQKAIIILRQFNGWSINDMRNTMEMVKAHTNQFTLINPEVYLEDFSREFIQTSSAVRDPLPAQPLHHSNNDRF